MADTVFDKVHVANTALQKLGLEASYSIDDESPLGGSVDAAWHSTMAEVMANYEFNAFVETEKPVALADPPQNGWQYGFVLPADRMGDPLAVLTDVTREAYLRSFMLEGGKLYTNVSPVWVRVHKEIDPQYWGAGLREAFALLLAGNLAVPLLQDVELEADRRAKAVGEPREQYGGGLFGRMKTKANAAQPQGRNFLTNSPLIAARL